MERGLEEPINSVIPVVSHSENLSSRLTENVLYRLKDILLDIWYIQNRRGMVGVYDLINKKVGEEKFPYENEKYFEWLHGMLSEWGETHNGFRNIGLHLYGWLPELVKRHGSYESTDAVIDGRNYSPKEREFLSWFRDNLCKFSDLGMTYHGSLNNLSLVRALFRDDSIKILDLKRIL